MQFGGTMLTSEQPRNPEQERAPTVAPLMVLLDFDRCIGDTDKLQQTFEMVAKDYITEEYIVKARKTAEDTGGSFDTARFVRWTLDQSGRQDEWNQLAKTFVDQAASQRQAGDSFLMPGGEELLADMGSRQVPFGFITYGGREWQQLKLAAAGLTDYPTLITETKRKGELIAEWPYKRLGDEGMVYQLPPELQNSQVAYAKHLVFLDDKPVSFEGAPPEGVTLIQVLSYDHVVASQRGELPVGVEHVSTLYEAHQRLNDLY